jgi:adenine/guanine phosphoribosyltransferase-like PRPP-binding protein
MIYHSVTYSADTTAGTFRDLREAVLRAIRTVEPHVEEFDTIAVQGVSGMSIGFPLALALGKEIVVVRKQHELDGASHSSSLVAGGHVGGKRCLFVDDFVSMGDTRNRVTKAIEAKGGKVTRQYLSREDWYGRNG